ncbi:DUF2892 domain-containing protein [Puniceicoccales bacterium CK1056]|uniref:DUF2892 domain-containing protein n=1 Tax=Oceanipulchritudo coccoides TaxID=2706888 RepID=A0A6B2LZZ5_9BACT|nr:DUF2892 domain-containing protein [Oceanipulchritudo coccoides]
MSIEQGVMAMAGSFVLVSVILGIIWTPWALGFTLFVGANLLQAAFTGFCPAAMVFAKLGLRGGCVFNK